MQTSLSEGRGTTPIRTLLKVSFRRSRESIILRLQNKSRRKISVYLLLSMVNNLKTFCYLALSLTAILIEEPGRRTLSFKISNGSRFGSSRLGTTMFGTIRFAQEVRENDDPQNGLRTTVCCRSQMPKRPLEGIFRTENISLNMTGLLIN